MAHTRSATKLSPHARLLMTQLERQYADASDEEWEELAEHMNDQLTVLSAGSQARRQALLNEFAALRARAVAGRANRAVLAQLAAGAATRVRDRGDGLEEWAVSIGETHVSLFVPVEDGSEAVALARTALLDGRCPACRLSATITAGAVEVSHNSRCPARSVLD